MLLRIYFNLYNVLQKTTVSFSQLCYIKTIYQTSSNWTYSKISLIWSKLSSKKITRATLFAKIGTHITSNSDYLLWILLKLSKRLISLQGNKYKHFSSKISWIQLKRKATINSNQNNHRAINSKTIHTIFKIEGLWLQLNSITLHPRN